MSSKGGVESNLNGPAGTADVEGAEMHVIDVGKAYPLQSIYRWFAHGVAKGKKAALVRIRYCLLPSNRQCVDA